MSRPHHSGEYHTQSRAVRALANANPLTLCWFCHRPLAAHPAHANGKPPRWTAGHTVDKSQTWRPWLTPLITVAQCLEAAAGDWLAPEASVCNNPDVHLQAANKTQPAEIVTTRRW